MKDNYVIIMFDTICRMLIVTFVTYLITISMVDYYGYLPMRFKISIILLIWWVIIPLITYFINDFKEYWRNKK